MSIKHNLIALALIASAGSAMAATVQMTCPTSGAVLQTISSNGNVQIDGQTFAATALNATNSSPFTFQSTATYSLVRALWHMNGADTLLCEYAGNILVTVTVPNLQAQSNQPTWLPLSSAYVCGVAGGCNPASQPLLAQ